MYLDIELTAEAGRLRWPYHWKVLDEDEDYAQQCPGCSLVFKPSKHCEATDRYLERWRCRIDHANIPQHLTELTTATDCLSSATLRKSRRITALRALFQLFTSVKHFVHFTSWGLSWDFIGMLAFMSHRVSVRGIVANCDREKAKQIRLAHSYGSDHFELVPLVQGDKGFSPHQKLIVIDGLVALKGSVNFTVTAWDKLDEGYEHLEVETRPSEVMRLNNELFAPNWAKLHPAPKRVEMSFAGKRWDESWGTETRGL
jgi:hypothetical protein